MSAGAALLFGETLFLLAFGAAPVHFALAQVVFKEEATAMTVFRIGLCVFRFATWQRAFEDSLALRTPVLSFKFSFTAWTRLASHSFLPRY